MESGQPARLWERLQAVFCVAEHPARIPAKANIDSGWNANGIAG
jgi:hypothetical protein